MMTVLFVHELYNSIENSDGYFDEVYDESWFTHDFCKRVLKEVDHLVSLGGKRLINPFSEEETEPEDISEGAKALILLYEGALDGKYMDLIDMEQDCVPFLSELIMQRDFTFSMSGTCLLFDGYPINAFCVNDQSMITSAEEWKQKLEYYAKEARRIGYTGIEYDIIDGGFQPHVQ